MSYCRFGNDSDVYLILTKAPSVMGGPILDAWELWIKNTWY